MAKFLLWNVQRKPLEPLVLTLVGQHAVDVVLLVESAGPDSFLANWLGRAGFRVVPSHARFGVFAHQDFSVERLSVSALTNRVDYFRMGFPSGSNGLIALVHNFDRRNYGDETRAGLFADVASNVRREEEKFGHRQSIICGDFNAHPFEPAVSGSHGLHALGVRAVRDQTVRRVAGTDRDFFYNPMWRAYGYGTDAGSATYFRAGNNAYELIWHMLDQVVVRPDGLAFFPEDKLRILDAVGARSLTRRQGEPNDTFASDHLPVLFEWNL